MGKTYLAVNQLIKRTLTCPHQHPRTAYIAPFYSQAKSISWDYMCRFSAPIPGITINRSELSIDYPNGGRAKLLGADNVDALRGIYLDYAILDEYSQMRSRLWGEVLRPTLADRKGGALFIGTPLGLNEFYHKYEQAKVLDDWYAGLFPASQTNLIDRDELEAARREMTDDEYNQEFECSFTAAVRGAIYGKEISTADAEHRITNVPYTPDVSVDTVWDLGFSDTMAIWFVQYVGQEVHFIDYYENSQFGLDHYVRVIKNKPYIYGQHWVPHDIKVHELGTGKTRLDTMKDLGLEVQTISDHRVADRIDATRLRFNRYWFDREKCIDGIEGIRNYRYEYDETNKIYKKTPLHDWASHPSDAFSYTAMCKPTTGRRKSWDKLVYPTLGVK